MSMAEEALVPDEGLDFPVSSILKEGQYAGTSIFQSQEKIVFNYKVMYREVEFPKRIQNTLFEVEGRIKELEEFFENEYKRTPKNRDVVSMAFHDFYKKHIFRKALRNLRNLYEICASSEDFVHYNNEICFLERSLKDDKVIKKQYYELLSIDIRNYLMYMEINGFSRETRDENELFKKDILRDIALLRQDVKTLFTDLRTFYIAFLERIENPPHL